MSRSKTTGDLPGDCSIVSPSRRDFLIRCCQGASTLLAPTSLWRLAFASEQPFQTSAGPGVHLHPHYRSQVALDSTLLKLEPGSDVFVSEKYAHQIEQILTAWSAGLRESPQLIKPIVYVLAGDFSGSCFAPAESRKVRSGVIEAWKNSFSGVALNRDEFISSLGSAFGHFSQIYTAEFQVTRVDANLPRVLTRIRYDLVGSGKDFYREQRTGYWDLEWEIESDKFSVKNWKTLGESSSRAVNALFADVTTAAFGNTASYRNQLLHGSDYWRTVLDGACGIDIYGHNGVSVGDIDNDGFDDVYVCQPAGLPNRLYRNCGDGTFEDVTENSGVGLLDNTSCALFVDIDNDGRQDLILVRTSGPVLFVNEGAGKFRQKADAFKFATAPQGTFTGAAVADYDRDGWLDIYFCLYAYYQGTEQYKYPLPYYDANNGPPNFMMRNNRDGTFSDVTAESGLNQNNNRYSFCCAWNDYDRDGWPDLYVVNDFGRKNLYRNHGDGTFTDVAAEFGAEDLGAGMSVCWFDYKNEGSEDLYVGNMWTAAGERISTQKNFQQSASPDARAMYQKHAMGNSLLRNTETGFQDVTGRAGVAMGRWAWSSDVWDFDQDGSVDLYITNGMISGPAEQDLNSFFWRQTVANSPQDAKPVRDYEQGWNAVNELIRADGTWSGYERNVLYSNNGDGTFSDVSGAAGLDFVEDGRSFALADLDHDGRRELLLKNRNAPQLRLLKSVIQELPPSIAFRLRGTKSNRDAIGATITLSAGDRRQTRSLQAGSGFLSQHSKELFFGLGDATGPVSASISWPGGMVQTLQNLPINHTIWVDEGSPSPRAVAFKPMQTQQGTKVNAAGAPHFAARQPEALPDVVETWLLSPISAPDFSLPDQRGRVQTLSTLRGKPVLLNFWTSDSPTCRELLRGFDQKHVSWRQQGLQVLTLNCDETNSGRGSDYARKQMPVSFPILRGSDDVGAIYNILYRYLFDRHRDLPLPTSLLIDHKGDIVKLYQGAVNLDHIDHDFSHIPRTNPERVAAALPFVGVTDASEFPRNYLSYGSVYFQRGFYEQAGAAFDRSFRDNPNSAEALYGVGSVYLQQEKATEARAAFERVTKMTPAYPETLPNAWNNLGLIATREGQTQKAIPYFEQALKLSPDHLIALDNLGNAYRDLQRWDDALRVLRHAVASRPDDPEANYSLGMVYAQLNNSDRAYKFLQEALKLRPDYPQALNNLGVLYLRTNQVAQAIASFEQCIKTAPAFDQSYLNLARVYALQNAPEKARSVLLQLLEQHPDHEIAKNMLHQLKP